MNELHRWALEMKTVELPGAGSIGVRQHLKGHRARGGGPGGVVWPCGESLAKWLAAQRGACGADGELDEEVHSALSTQSVASALELGSGTGIVGLALSRLGVSSVVATDGDPASVALCAENAQLAGLPVTSCHLPWGGDEQQLEQVLEQVGRSGRCAEWIIGGDVVYEAHSSRELEVTLRELILRGGCSLVLIAWCERGQQAESFLWRLQDLGSARTVFRAQDSKYSYLTRRHGKLMQSEVEFGISLLSISPHITAGCGAICMLRQRIAIQLTRASCAIGHCLAGGSITGFAGQDDSRAAEPLASQQQQQQQQQQHNSPPTATPTPSRSELAVQRVAAEEATQDCKDEAASLSDAQGQRWVPFVKTAHSRVYVALRALRITSDDLFVDLGCGDGRMALAAAADFGARSVGIDISPALLRLCNRAAEHAGISCAPGSRLRFLLADMGPLIGFEASDAPAPASAPAAASLNPDAASLNPDAAEAVLALSSATAIYVYALPLVMPKLTPFLLRAIARGARVLTLDHHMPSASDTEAVAHLPPDCRALTRYLTPREVHLFGKMRLHCAQDVIEEAPTPQPLHPQQGSPQQGPQPSLPRADPAAASSDPDEVHPSQSGVEGRPACGVRPEAHSAALLAHVLPRRSRMPNRVDPWDCTLAFEAISSALLNAPCWQSMSTGAQVPTPSAGPIPRLLTIGSRQVGVVEAGGDYATRLWFSSIELAKWLHRHARSFEGTTVLELGAGTGLCSLALAAEAPGARLIASDVSAAGLALVDAAARDQGLRVECVQFDVCSEEPLPAAAQWLIASDVLYTPQLARGLARRFAEIVRRGGRAIVADPGRPTRRLFQVALEQEGFRADFLPLTTALDGRSLVLLHVDGEHSVSNFVAAAELSG